MNKVLLENQKIETRSILNARQLGGYKTSDGRTIRKNLLIRTAALNDVSDEDRKILTEKYKVHAVVDFRSDFERLRSPDCQLPSCVNYPINVLGDVSNAGLTKEILEKIKKADEIERFHLFATLSEMQEIYYNLVKSDISKAGFKKFFQILLETESGAVIWHCSQGKDRTGFSAILLLSALGVDAETAIMDFALSNDSYKELTDKVRVRAKTEGWTEWELENTLAMTGVSVKYMKNAIDFLKKEYGSIESYIKNQLGLTEEEILRLKEKFLE